MLSILRKIEKPGPMVFGGVYVWLVFASALDILMTWSVLYFGGREVNRIAELVIHAHGLPGMILYKFSLVILAVILCEEVARRRIDRGRTLARLIVGMSFVPFVWATAQILMP